MKTKLIVPVLLSLMVGFSSCSSMQKLNPLAMLTQNTWVLSALKGVDLGAFGDKLPFLNFAQDGGLTGNTGCNNFTGNFKLDGTSLNLDPGAMTRMACPGTGEQSFLDGLGQVTGMNMDGNTLNLLGQAGQLMSFVPKK
jgi:heat shock protein HslJ